jgi:hypothetical protein
MIAEVFVHLHSIIKASMQLIYDKKVLFSLTLQLVAVSRHGAGGDMQAEGNRQPRR